MAGWGVMEAATEDGGGGEVDEDHVPFIMKLDHSGLRIISKMRRINYMVRTYQAFIAWVKAYEKNKERAKLFGDRLAKILKETDHKEDSDEEGANQHAQQKKLLAHDDSDSDDHPEGLDAHCEVDIFVSPHLGDVTHIRSIRQDEHFEKGILSIHKYKGTCWHLYFKKFKDDEEDLGAVVTAHRDTKLPGEDFRTFSVTCIHGIQYRAKGAVINKEALRRKHHPHNNLRHVVARAREEFLSTAPAEIAPEQPQVMRTLVRTQSLVKVKALADGPEYNSYIFRFREFNRGRLTDSCAEVGHFLSRLHEAEINNHDAFEYLRQFGGALDIQSAAKYKERQLQMELSSQEKLKFTAAQHFSPFSHTERMVRRIQKLFRKMKDRVHAKHSIVEQHSVLRHERDFAAIKVQSLYRSFHTRKYVLASRRRMRLQECITAARGGDVLWAEQMILRKGVAVNSCDAQSLSILHHAAATNHELIIVKLVELRADLHAQDSKGNTPLHLACAKRFVAAARRLVLLGADVEAQNLQGATPLARPRFFLVSIVNEIMAVEGKLPSLGRTARTVVPARAYPPMNPVSSVPAVRVAHLNLGALVGGCSSDRKAQTAREPMRRKWSGSPTMQLADTWRATRRERPQTMGGAIMGGENVHHRLYSTSTIAFEAKDTSSEAPKPAAVYRSSSSWSHVGSMTQQALNRDLTFQRRSRTQEVQMHRDRGLAHTASVLEIYDEVLAHKAQRNRIKMLEFSQMTRRKQSIFASDT